MSPPELDSFRLPEADENGVVSTCIPFNLDISSLGLGETLEVEMKIQGTGKSENRLVEKHLTDSRVQIIIPVSDPVLDDVGPPEWLGLHHASGISIQRKSWNEGKIAKIVLRRETEETNDLELNILVVLNKLELKLDEFHLEVKAEKTRAGGGRQNLAMQYVSFTEDWQADCFGGSDEDLMMNVFMGKGAYEIMQDGSLFHPKQIHSYNSVTRALEEKMGTDEIVDITYVGPDTCENLHSVIRAVNRLVSNGLKVGKFYILHTRWDERSMDNLKLLKEGYFRDKGCNFEVEFLPVDSSIQIESDLIITTYVTNWAFNSGKRGTAAEQYLSNIIKQIRNEHSIIISVDPFDEKRVTRSFHQLGHQGNPKYVYQSAGLELQKSAPGGYGDIIQEQEREICWVTCYKEKSQLVVELDDIAPKPNDIAKSLGIVNPAGRDAYLERLSTPMLERYSNLKKHLEVKNNHPIENETDEEFEEIPDDDWMMVNTSEMIQNNERFRLVIGGPGDGKTVLLQQMGWNKRSEENEVTTILSARRLARKEHMLVFSMHEGEQKASMFFETIESECNKKYSNLNWDGHLKDWIENDHPVNIFIDALDEVRDIKSRAKLFSLLLDVSNLYSNINITLSMRDNILIKSFRDLDELRSGNLYTEIDVNSESFDLDLDESQAEFSDDFDNISIYKLLWSEKRIVDDFIPSLLHGWNMKIDLQSEKELERFISRSTKSLNRSSRGSRIFLKSPLRAVWLVRFVYDQSVILDDMDLSEFENEILRLSVKNRFESRRLKNQVPDEVLDELLDFVATISVLDYDWAGQTNDFNEENRLKFVDLISSSKEVNSFFNGVEKRELELFLFEDMSLLYIAGDDNLAWVHENLREHAIARGLLKNNDVQSIPHSLLSKWGFSPPDVYEIFCNPQEICSIELSEAIRRIIPNDVLIRIASNWVKNSKDKYDIEWLTVPEFDSDELTNFTNLRTICGRLRKHFKEKRDEINSQTREHTIERNNLNKEVKGFIQKVREQRSERDRFNKMVKEQKKLRNEANGKVKLANAEIDKLVMSKYDLKDGVSKKKLRQSRAKFLSSSDLTSDDKAAITNLENSMKSQEIAHEGVQNAAKAAQEAHQLMIEINKEVDRLRGLAEAAHRRLRQSKKVADKLHNEFIFLLTRLGRELNKREKYLLIDSYQNFTESWAESVKNEIIEFYEEEFESRTDIKLPESADISLSTGKKECIVRIESAVGGALVGIGQKRSVRLSKILANKYHIDFKITIKGSDLSSEELDSFIKMKVEEYILKRSGDYDLDVSEIEYRPFIDKKTGKSQENRMVVLRSKYPKMLHEARMLNYFMTILRRKFGGHFRVISLGIDIEPMAVREKLFEILDDEGLSDFVSEIKVYDNSRGVKGRQIEINTSNPILLREKMDFGKARNELASNFGLPLIFSIHDPEISPLSLDDVRTIIEPIIHRVTEGNPNFKLHDLILEDYHGMKNRQIIVKCNPHYDLIGRNGSIAREVTKELEDEFGYLRFVSQEPDIDKPQIHRFVQKFISNIENLPEGFDILTLKVEQRKSPLTTVKILTTNDEWLANIGWTLRDLRKQLEEEFGGKFKILNKGSHQVTNSSNLKSEVVEKSLREFIVENGKEWDLSEVLFSADIEVSSLHNITGRLIILDCQSIFCNEESTYPIELIEIFKQLSEHLNETFGPPFSIYFKVNFDEDELKRCVTQYLLDEGVSEFEQSMIELVPLHSLPNRKIILSGTKIPSTVKSELVKKLKLIFGLPLTVKLE